MNRTIAGSTLIAFLATAGCGSSDGDNVTQTTSVVPADPADVGSIYGVVNDSLGGSRLTGVSVSVGAKSTTTDSSGRFTLTGLTSGAAVVSLTKTAYAPGYENVKVGDTAEAVIVVLKREGTRQTYNPTTSKTLSEKTEAGPYAVTFAPNTLDTTDTNLRVAVTPLDPTKESSSLPGNLIASNAMLEPLTFAEFSIFDSAGNRVNLKASAEAIVELPIPPTLRANSNYQLGKTIHCYSYNPITGQWEDFVVGTIVKSSVDGTTPVVKASIKHFSWYGAAPETNDCMSVTVSVLSAFDKKPMPGARVEAFPGTAAYTDKNGLADLKVRGNGNTRYVATRTYTDTDGSISGMPGAKVIDIGEVNEELVGLVKVPCSGSSGKPSSGSGLSARVRGASNDPLAIQLGRVGTLNYEATVSMITSGTTGIVSASLRSVLPGGDEGPPVSGAIMTLRGNGITDTRLQEFGGNGGEESGVYFGFDIPLVQGQLYTIDIDADANGSIDGSGIAYAVGALTWDKPTIGSTASATNLVASWLDSGTATAGYSAVYLASIRKEPTTAQDVAIYLGTNREFSPKTLNEGPLGAGTYKASVTAFSGAYGGLGSTDFDVINNISGATVTGQFFSYSGLAGEATFTISNP